MGCGDVARRALPWLVRRFRVYALVRDAAGAAALRAPGVTPVAADLDRPHTLARLAGLGEWVLHLAPPPDQGGGDPRMRHLLAALARGRVLPRRISYISTTGVYGDCCGRDIDETRPLRPQTARARRRRDAERHLRQFGRRTGTRVGVLRAPGIYAADRLPLERLRRGLPVLRPEDDVFTNHIHADDLARACALALFRARPGRCYNACDDSRLAMGDWYDQLADAFGLARPPRVSREQAQAGLPAATLSFMGESRRIANLRLKRELRLRLQYPDVTAGLAAACNAGDREG